MLTERIAQLQAETDDLREQNELLEFRILELEECHDNVSHKHLSQACTCHMLALLYSSKKVHND